MCNLKALDALHAANMRGTDATTSLDAFVSRAARHFANETQGMSIVERNDRLVEVFGSDAVRVASVMIGGLR